MTDFVHLHLHTEYSLLDGAVRINREVPVFDDPEKKSKKIHPLGLALKDRGMDAVAITDHGNMYGVHMFVSAMRAEGIKPIIGEEFYVADDMYEKTPETMHQRYHLILLAKNEVGYKNLMILSSLAFEDGFYFKPRIDLKHIAEHSEGLICLSACLAGQIPQLILHRQFEEAKALAIKMRDMFAPGDFYIELQDHHLPEDKLVTNPLCQIAKEIGVKVVATNDVHYIEKKDADAQDTMMCINLKIKKEEFNNARFENDEFYLKSGDEMAELFSWCPEAIASTREIADKVDGNYFITKRGENIIPVYTNEEMGDRTESEYLRDLAWEGAKRKYGEITEEIENRLNYELGVISECGYCGYFLIVWDYVHAAQKMGMPVGPGRGSGCGSIVAYTIGITDIDPLKYNLLFERFLSKERVSMPDFDIDFCYMRRAEMIDYCIEKYGRDRVAQIAAYGTMSAKAVIKDVARVFDVSFQDSANIIKDIPDANKGLILQMLKAGDENFCPGFRNVYDTDPRAHDIIDKAIELEGMPRQIGLHAAGVVICSGPIVNYCPLGRNDKVIATQFDKTMVEPLGLLKMDFLGLKTLTDIDEAIKLIKEDKGIDIDFHKIGYDDPKVYELMSSGDCVCVFQLESEGMTKFMAQLQPGCLEDVIAGIALYRPGPLQFIPQFIAGKRDPNTITYLHPLLEPILSTTYGCIVYQEQVMQIARSIAGFTFGGADIMRRAISKKKLAVLQAQRQIFIHGGVLDGDDTHAENPGAVAKGVSEEIANKLFDQILDFASYAFNKSHAAAYTFLTYQTAWLKCYYGTHFMVAVINNRINDAKELRRYMNYIKRIGTKVLPPDINKSKRLFSIEGNDIRYGLEGIKGVGEKAMEYILEDRRQFGPFKDIRDFCERCFDQINSRMVENLIKGGAFDFCGETRATLMSSYEKIMDAVAVKRKSTERGQISLFDELLEDAPISYNKTPEWDKLVKLAFEKDVLGMYISGHPLDDYTDKNQGFTFDTSQIYVVKEELKDSKEDGKEDEIKIVEETGEEEGDDLVLNKSLDGTKVRFGGMITTMDKKSTKKKEKYAVGFMDDKQGTISYTIFPRGYEQYKDLLEGDTPVIVTGRLDIKEDEEPKIIIEKMETWYNSSASLKQSPIQQTSGEIVYVNIRNYTERDILINVVDSFPGDTQVRFQMTQEGQKKIFVCPRKADVSGEFLSELYYRFGEANVKIKQL